MTSIKSTTCALLRVLAGAAFVPASAGQFKKAVYYHAGNIAATLSDRDRECKWPWVLKKCLNRRPFHLRVCRRRFSYLRSTKWWPAEPVWSADGGSAPVA